MSKTIAIWSLRKYREGLTGAIYDPMMGPEESALREQIGREIGLRIKDAREAREWSQEKLGLLTGFHRNSVMRWESGECAIDAVSLYLVCCALDVSPIQMLRLITVADERDKLPLAACGHS